VNCETSVSFHDATLRSVPEGSHILTRRSKNLKSLKDVFLEITDLYANFVYQEVRVYYKYLQLFLLHLRMHFSVMKID
jgi:hypothetical protein